MSSSGGQGRAARQRREPKQHNGTAAGTGTERTGKPASSAKQKEEKVFEDKISQVVQLTGKTKDEVVIALYDCDNDPNRAVNMLLEGDDQGQWVEKTKKKKPPKPAAPEPRGGERDESRGGGEDGGAGRGEWGRSGDRSQPPRLRRGAGQDRSWKSRESWENERNAAGRDGGGGATRGGRGGRRGGRGGGGRGGPPRSRAAPSTGDSWGASSAGDSWGATSTGDWGAPAKSTDDWGAPAKATDDWGASSSSKPTDDWGGSTLPASEDWDEWGGSLTDTKVFTASPSAPDESVPASSTAAVPASPLGTSLELGALVQPSDSTAAGSGAPTYSQLAAAPAAGPLSYSSAITRSLQPPAPVPPAASPQPPAVSAVPQRPPASAPAVAAFSAQPSEFTTTPASSAPASEPVRTAVQSAAFPADPSVASGSSGFPSQPVSSGPEPTAVQQQSSVYSQPSSVYSQPSSVYSQPSSVYSQPSSVYSQPSSVYSQPSSVYSQPSSVYSQPSSVYSQPSSVYSQPSSVYSAQSSLSSAPASFPSGYTNPPGLMYSSSFVSGAPASSVAGSALSQSLASRTSRPQKGRVQPPAKIPDMAVEMPDDVSTLDVKFGGLDFGTAAAPAADEPASFTATAAAPAPAPQPDPAAAAAPAPSESEATATFPPHARSPTLGPLVSAAQPVKTSLESAPASFAGGSGGGGGAAGSPGLTSVGGGAAAAGPSSAPVSSSPSVPSSLYGSGSGPASGDPPFGQLPAVSAAPSGLPAPGFGASAGPAAAAAADYSQPEQPASGGGGYQTGAGLTAHTGYSNGGLLPERLSGVASKTSQYEASSSSTGGSSGLSSTPSAAAAAAAAAVPSAGGSGTSTARGSANPITTRPGGVPSLPPGVPMQYFVGQTAGMPFYPGMPGVQPFYNYEELHALQQRLPHMQQSAGGGQGRPEVSSALGSGSGGYSGLSDAKFGRHDNSSPVQSALSQQLKSHQQQQQHQQHQQPHHQQQQQPQQQQQQPQQQQQQQFFNPAGIPPNYTYFPFMPQYGIYTPMPPATAAPASSGGGQYQKVAGYGAGGGFGAGYDPLGSGGDFKAGGGGFGGSSPHKSGGGGGELAAGYGKAPLAGKYDTKAFHTGTPPPFPLAGQGQSGAYGQHLFLQPLPTQAHSPLVHPAHQESALGGPARGSQPKPAGKPSYGYWPGN